MAWVEGKTWEMEQGVDARLELKLWANTAKTTPFIFTGWTIYGFVSDTKRSLIYPLDLSESDSAAGSLVAILPEATVNSLKVGKEWVYNILAVAPGSEPADDVHVAFGPAVPTFRPARRTT
jgi:hypothetical protein